ncbi:MAG: RnfABCDGE type electron transport complex subunit C [Solobacterium sp.]|jgi:electron transport complex protein RnfC|nr:RnfABCDGE type electron transport complex subunit C [Solobacterium sp.]MBQ1322002.1 RnfABCDGE type electron transport complex subunit C [Solobacterium sp.]MBQ3273547.1 RnfABCDGE type electron transport complex subunit C [Solobacterium sp.]MBQ6356835.1 RnfABCDGE type electron transport complex subunit C [Solobacterium sp.]MBR0213859.1 RnfABCDGE type electron transport complex subunit C [Solobacterium sp.]
MSFLTGPMHHHLEGHKDLTNHKEILRLEEPDVIWIPLNNGAAPCTPLVNVGDEVKVGTKIAERNDHFYLPLFSPVSGTVTGIEKKMNSAMKMVDHMRIENDHKKTVEKPFEPFDYEKATREELLDFVKNAGMLGLGGAGFPTYVKYLKPEGIKSFIINGVECEPYLTTDYRSMMDNLELLKTGVLAMFKLSKAERGCVAVKEDKVDLIAELKKTFEGTPIEIRTVPDIYPAGWERTLVWLLEQKRYDRLPAEVGCIINNASTAIALADALLNGMPVTHKLVTVSGDGVADPHNVYVPVGTTAHDIVQACGGYTSEDCMIIAGGPMMGSAIPNDTFVIGPANNGLTVLKHEPLDVVKCLRCGKCTEMCPSGLEPVRINNAEKVKDIETLKKLDTLSCIECGLCSYICPSKIDVTEGIRRAKRYLALAKK